MAWVLLNPVSWVLRPAMLPIVGGLGGLFYGSYDLTLLTIGTLTGVLFMAMPISIVGNNFTVTWEERDVTSWAVSRFAELLQEEVCQVSPAINLKFRDVLRVVGDAQVVVFQRRTRYLFDFSEVELAWAAQSVDGRPLFNGRCIIRDAASGAAAADLELETASSPANDEEKAVGDSAQPRSTRSTVA